MTKILLLSDINSVHTQKWVLGLLKEGYQIHVFSLAASISNWHKDLDSFSFTTFYDDNELISQQTGFSKLKYLKAVKKIKNTIAAFNPDIVHAHYATSYGLLGRLAKARPFVLSFWGSDVFEFPGKSIIHKTVFKWIIRYPNELSSTSYKMIEELSKYTKRNIHCIPFGIDCEVFKPSGDRQQNNKLIIGTVKALEDVYGIDRLIQAYSIFRQNYKSDSKLLIYGKGSKENELKHLVSDLSLNEHVAFIGFVSGPQLIKAFESIDIFVALSRSESFGVAILEASAMELPVVVSDAGGLPEVVQNEISGFIVPDGNANAAAKFLLQLVDENKRREFGIAGRKMVVEKYNFSTSIKMLTEIYNKLIPN